MWFDPLVLRRLPTGPREARPDDKLSKRLEGRRLRSGLMVRDGADAPPHHEGCELIRRLLAKLGYVIRREFRSLGAEARGDIVGDGGDLVVAIGIAERRHRERA